VGGRFFNRQSRCERCESITRAAQRKLVVILHAGEQLLEQQRRLSPI
jgi:hypothetical protein